MLQADWMARPVKDELRGSETGEAKLSVGMLLSSLKEASLR